MRRLCSLFVLILCAAVPAAAQATAHADYRVLATSKTSTMEKELNAAAQAGFRFDRVMGGETGFGGKEVVVIAGRAPGRTTRYEYQLLATNKTSTMQKELQAAAERGFEYRAQTVFETTFGGREVVCILERNLDEPPAPGVSYKLLATSRTSTMQKELAEAAAEGYEVVGMTVGKTTMGGSELVTILRRSAR